MNLSILKTLGAQLIDIHSQHQNIYLESSAFQLRILDTYAQQLNVVAAYNQEYLAYRKLLLRLEELEKAAGQQQTELDYLRFRFEELTGANLREDEQVELENEQKALTHAEEIKNGLLQISNWLDTDEASVVQVLRAATAVMGRLQQVYPRSGGFRERMEASLIELKDIASETEQIAEAMEYNPGRLEEVNVRLDLLYSLQQKHKVSSVKELMVIRDELDIRIQEINNYDQHIETIRKQLEEAVARLGTVALEISDKRKAAAPAIEEHIHVLLRQLSIPNAVFKVELTTSDAFTPTGTDDIRFLFSANRQQNLQDLGKVASGGEISRLMLSIKAAIAEKIVLPTLIFDEIDTGVSGEVAEKMGNIIEQMASYTQIINITHLPQVAAKGQHHYKVYKEDHGAVTQTKVYELSADERVMEIAKMLSGEKVTNAAMENARHLLKMK